MAHARVAVVTYPDTPFIEAMLLGVPTIGLWPSALWELRDDAREPFDLLKEVGVIFEDPVAAAARLDVAAIDPEAWWGSADVQAARRAFLARFAAVGRRPLEPWVTYLRSLSRGASTSSTSNGNTVTPPAADSGH
jgi:putative transferase (TIGR04331 family)